MPWTKGRGGNGGTPMQSIIFSQEEAKYDVASGGPFGIGLGMCIPTLMTYGSDDAKQRYVVPAVQGDEIWCQLFSEPAGGPDRAGAVPQAREKRGTPDDNQPQKWETPPRSAPPRTPPSPAPPQPPPPPRGAAFSPS